MGRIVVMDTETTGLSPNKHDLIQIACIALNNDFTPDKNVQPFYMLIKPAHFQDNEAYYKEIEPAMNVNKLSIKKIMEIGFEPTKAAQLFEEWWGSLGGQPLDPLCQNYPFDSSFMKAWLGDLSYSHFFSRYYRDTYAGAQFIADQADFNNCKPPFPNGKSLTKLANELKIEVTRAHDAFSDCITTAEVYKRLCTYIPIPRAAAAN